MTLKRKSLSELGQSTVEFALVAPVIILLFMGIFEFGRFYYARLTLQHAVHEATRFAVTGATIDDGQGNPLSRAESIKGVIMQQATALDLDVDLLVITPPDGGGPGEVVTVTGNFTYDFMTPGFQNMFPGGQYAFTVSTAMKNEPFFEN